ncbi:MAG: hypothetical protein K0B00_07935 [Rhodobacteraceae bacterium]|nr:hypothetical protein [Paracoccaceae bacterium]
MKTLKIIATLTLGLFPAAAFAEECNGDHVASSLICPSTLTSGPAGGCVHAG